VLVAWVYAALAAAPSIDVIAEVERHQQELFERIAPSVVFISDKRGFGSGVLIDSDSLILTNAHVVGDASEVTVVTHDGKKLRGKVVERGEEEVDVALVEVPATHLPFLTILPTDELRVGSWVAAVGHGSGGIWAFNTGMVSNIYPGESGRPVFQTQIPLNPGSSGGPVIDRKGRLVGVVTSGMTNSNSINFAIRASAVVDSLPRLRQQDGTLVITVPAGVRVFLDGVMVGVGPAVTTKPTHGKHEVRAVIGGKMLAKTVEFPSQRRVEFP
jgi:S1-C subfamily serine protease